MSTIAALLVIPDALLAFAWLRLTGRKSWLAAWLVSWTASAVAVAAMILYAFADVPAGVGGAACVAVLFAVTRFIWTPGGPRHAGRHQ